jgi:predicted metal-binding membrane protein
MATAIRPRRRVGPTSAAALLLTGLAATAWLVLAALDASAWSRYLHHDGLAGSGLGPAATVAVFTGGWVLMLAAMMLPTAHPLVVLFDGLVSARRERRQLVALVVAGYVTVWTLAGLAAFGLDMAVHAVVDAVPAIERSSWLLGAVVLGGAGAYQLSDLKERCLTRCRNPRAVLVLRWRGRAPVSESFTIGAAHGAECLSCCWALMLVLFALGAGNLGWMLAAGAVMAAEKLAPWGRHLRRPVGVALLLGAATVVAFHL